MTQPASSALTHQPAARALEAILTDPPSLFPAVRLTAPDTDAVVLARRDRTVDVILDNGFVRTLHVSDTARPITEPAREAELLRRALRSVEARAVTAERSLREDTERHTSVLAAVRAYAIGKHRDGDICRRGLDGFLEAFDMPPYEPRIRVTFTITGSYLVAAENTREAESDAQGYLKADLSSLDNVVEDSDEITVHIDDVSLVDSGSGDGNR
ncbi:hypothetical protein [Spirilliplanes yamanashiensis]|uniref:Uncharacterized protein n=1 Tax=Spirilliplanes yamanashiensis TaxID=42233 RepID=A0A8J3YEW0_9ACTN|nr:hypothetical protein [Spirilliplanes yamanashiensis]MDP9818476.1 chorismate mutase [Spirilliplanes yamanashiensis]GIJ06398.1 hypothetical protein Sya03_57500 [Spirilliplanes yamanashiensis]